MKRNRIEKKPEDLVMNFAIVFRGKLKDFYGIEKFIEKKDVDLIYVHKSTEFLFVRKEGEINDRKGRWKTNN